VGIAYVAPLKRNENYFAWEEMNPTISYLEESMLQQQIKEAT